MLEDRCDSRIGPVSRLARLVVGLALVAYELFVRDPKWWDPVVGLIAVPALMIGIGFLWSRSHPSPFLATGPIGHLVNLMIFVPALFFAPTAGAAMLFYGGSMLLAAATANGGCEVTAFSNLVLRRDDQIGCALFAPVDLAERAAAEGRASSS